MAGRHWEDWFEREEFIGHISDIRVQNLQVERQVVQKRTFTRWMNLHLKKCDPPLQIQDLFQDIQDGYVLMALLEELSGSKLLHGFKKSTHRIFRLNNIAKVLSFLEERNVKLVSIDAVDITDGNSSIILGLIWNIILFFQIKELTGNIRSQFPSSSSLSSIPTSSDSDTSFSSTPSEERQSVATTMKENSKAIKKLLQWIQRRTRKYGVAVQDFGKSWTSGLAFLAVIKSIDSSLVDMSKALLRTPRENLQDAFRIAHYSLGIPRLLEPEDVTINVPDEQSIIIYVSQFLEHFPGIQESEVPSQTIERSVSMSRLSFREIDSEHMRNGAHRSRVKQCSFMFQKDSTQPPPKQLISSVSEDRSVLEPRFRVAAARSWSSEDILSDPPHTEDAPNSVDVNPKDPSSDLLQEFGSSQQLFTQSPSSVPESLIGDSAINSPDSWMEGELNPDRYCESHSDSSLCDSGMAWDVYRATPVEVTPYDEGFISSVEDRAPEESIIETYIDDGMSSQDTIDMQTVRNPEEKPENESLNQDEGPDSVGDFRENKNITHLDEIPFHQDTVTGEKEPLDNMCEAEELDSPAAGDPQKLDQLNQFEPIFSTEPPEEIPMKKQDGEGSYQDGKHTSPTESQERRSEMETEDHRTDLDLQDEEVEFNEGNDSAVECLDILRDFTQCKKTNSSESSPKPSLNIPLISITSEPEELDKETEPYTVILDCDEFEDEERNTETQASEGPDPLSSVSSKDDEPGNTPGEQGGTHLEGNYDNKEKKDVSPESDSQRDGDVSAQCPSENILNQPKNPDEDSRTLAVGHLDKPTERDTDNSPQNLLDSFDCFQSILDAGSLKLNGQIGTLRSQPEDFPRNQFSSDFGRSSPAEDLVGDRVEPMDLFYPDKEESLLPEPPEIDVRWPLVLSVSALQPAPTSDRPEDLNVDFLSEEFTTGGEQDQITSLTNQTPSDPPPSQEQCVMCGVTIGAPQDSDDSETDNKGSSLRIDSVRSDDIHIPPVLRHRKGGRLSDSKEKPRGAPITAEPEDSDLWWRENWELCLLLLLWLLLYSFMVLPQLDLKMLPSLLLNQ